MIGGITHCRLIRTHAEDEWALNPASVAAAVEADRAAGLIPFFLCATVGTTSSCAVDPLRPLGELTQQHGLWCVLLLDRMGCILQRRRAPVQRLWRLCQLE